MALVTVWAEDSNGNDGIVLPDTERRTAERLVSNLTEILPRTQRVWIED